VKGLSGSSGDKIIARFMPGMRPLGTEVGRTSRGILPAARRLAERLNLMQGDIGPLSAAERGRLADAMQRWLVENPIKEYFEADKLAPDIDLRRNTVTNVGAILGAARQRNQVGPVAQHLVGAKLSLRFPGQKIQNYSHTAADRQTGRHGDFIVHSTVFHVATGFSMPLVRKCKANLREGYRVVVLVPEDRRQGCAEVFAQQDMGDQVTVAAIESFIAQNVDEVAEFDEARLEAAFRRFLEIYNARVAEAEPDPSLVIAIPERLGNKRFSGPTRARPSR